MRSRPSSPPSSITARGPPPLAIRRQVCATFATNVRGTQHLLAGLRAMDADVRVLIPSCALIYQQSAAAMREDHPLVPGHSCPGSSQLAQELLASLQFGPRAGRYDVRSTTPGRHRIPLSPRRDSRGRSRRSKPVSKHPEIAVGNLDARRTCQMCATLFHATSDR